MAPSVLGRNGLRNKRTPLTRSSGSSRKRRLRDCDALRLIAQLTGERGLRSRSLKDEGISCLSALVLARWIPAAAPACLNPQAHLVLKKELLLTKHRLVGIVDTNLLVLYVSAH
jgi:hypothetical protein